MPFEQAKSQIADKLAAQHQSAEMQKYLRKLRSQAIIEWKNDEIEKAWKTGLAAQEKQGN